MSLLERALSQYCEICSRSEMEKRNGWQQAQEIANQYPEILGELPELLKKKMLARKSTERPTESGGKSE